MGGGPLLEVASNQNNQKEHNYWGKFINKGPSIFYVSKRTGLVGLEISFVDVQYCMYADMVGQKKPPSGTPQPLPLSSSSADK